MTPADDSAAAPGAKGGPTVPFFKKIPGLGGDSLYRLDADYRLTSVHVTQLCGSSRICYEITTELLGQERVCGEWALNGAWRDQNCTEQEFLAAFDLAVAAISELR